MNTPGEIEDALADTQPIHYNLKHLEEIISNIRESLQSRSRGELLKHLYALSRVFGPHQQEQESEHNHRISILLGGYFCKHGSEIACRMVPFSVEGIFRRKDSDTITDINEGTIYRSVSVEDILACKVSTGRCLDREILFLKANGIAIDAIYEVIGKSVT